MAFHLSAAHLGRISDDLAFEPQRANNGIIVITGPNRPEGWGFPTGADAHAAITLALDSFPIPSDENAVLEMHYMNEVQKVASKARTAELEITIKDFVDVPVAGHLKAWRQRVYNSALDTNIPFPRPGALTPPQGGLGRAKNYKAEAGIYLIAPDGLKRRYYRCSGVWPSSMTPGTIDMASEEQVKIQVVLQIDRISDWDLEEFTL